MKYLIGCDFGGGAAKSTLLAENGTVVAEAGCDYDTAYPQPGWAEQNPEDSFRAFVENIRTLLRRSGIKAADVSALALSGATHTAVLLDERDEVVRPSIYWTDQRAVKEAQELQERFGERITSLSYNTIGALWTLPQLLWLRRNEPENFARIHKIMAVKDYVRYRLTGDFVTDEIEACGFMLLDVGRGEWSKELCEMAGIDVSALPQIVPPTQILSPMCRSVCELCGLDAGTRVIAGATDTVMEVYAAGAVRAGQATVKLATAGRICVVTERPMIDRNLVCYPHVSPGLWYPGTATKSCAASYRWYRDTFGRYESEHSADAFAAMAEEAAQVEPGCQGLFFHPYLQGELTPYQDESLRASFTGIRAYHTKAHFTRAVLEGVCYSLRDCLEMFRSVGAVIDRAAIIGGGAKGALWRQITADVLDIPLVKNERADSSLGTAMLAGVAVGLFASFEESAEKCVVPACEVWPDRRRAAQYAEEFGWYKRVHDALAAVYQERAQKEHGNLSLR